MEMLAEVRAQGFAIDDQEHSMGVRCIAAPVFDHGHQVVAAISTSTLTGDTSREDFEALVPPVRETAKAISETLGRKG